MNQQTQSVPSPYVNQAEMIILKKYFKDNDDLLIAMRTVMLDLDPTEEERNLVEEAFSDTDLFNFVSYRFMPEMKKSVAIGQFQDPWLGLYEQLTFQSEHAIKQLVTVSELSHKMMTTAIARLADTSKSGVDLSVDTIVTDLEADPLATRLLARARFIRSVESQLMALKTVASQPEKPSDAAAADSSR